MDKGSDSGVKGDYSDSPDNPDREPGPIKPVDKKYGTKTGSQGHWKGVGVSYEINIRPDKNGRLKF